MEEVGQVSFQFVGIVVGSEDDAEPGKAWRDNGFLFRGCAFWLFWHRGNGVFCRF